MIQKGFITIQKGFIIIKVRL